MRDNGADDESRPAHRPRRVLPRLRGGRRAHARRLGRDLRRPVAAVRRVRRPARAQAAPRATLPPEARLSPARPEPAGVGGRSPLQRRLPRAAHGAARAGGRAGAAPPGGPRVRPAARPLQAAVGDLARRPRGRGSLRAHLQDAPLPRRRHLRRGHHHRAVRPGARAAADRAPGAVGPPARAELRDPARRRHDRARGRAGGPGPRRRRRRRAAAAGAGCARLRARRAWERSPAPGSQARRPRRSTSGSARTGASPGWTPTWPRSRRSRTRSAARSTTSS